MPLIQEVKLALALPKHPFSSPLLSRRSCVHNNRVIVRKLRKKRAHDTLPGDQKRVGFCFRPDHFVPRFIAAVPPARQGELNGGMFRPPLRAQVVGSCQERNADSCQGRPVKLLPLHRAKLRGDFPRLRNLGRGLHEPAFRLSGRTGQGPPKGREGDALPGPLGCRVATRPAVPMLPFYAQAAARLYPLPPPPSAGQLGARTPPP
jgi:hypothetical protein